MLCLQITTILTHKKRKGLKKQQKNDDISLKRAFLQTTKPTLSFNNKQRTVADAELDVTVRKGHAINAVGVVMETGTRILSKHFPQSL
jgi:hypothetical protein